MPRKFKNGDIVRYAEKWCTPEERDLIHVITQDCLINPCNGGNRYDITTLNGMIYLGGLLPVECVDEEMIELVEN